MSLDDAAPQFFAAALGGIAPEGPNIILSFSTPIPSSDHKSRKYCTNVRVVMSVDAVRQMAEWLQGVLSAPAQTVAHQMPETPQ